MKKQARKIIAALLAGVLMFLLAACGQASDTAKESQKPAEETAVVEESDILEEAADTGDAAADEDSDFEVADEDAESALEENADEDPSDVNVGNFGTFTTVDLNGNEVTQDVFAQKEYTMVNLWGTFCPPCIEEMPDLEKINEELPENLQIVGLICDLYYENDDAKVHGQAEEILANAGVQYQNLLMWSDADELISSITAFVPTTFFVDSEGNIIDVIIGANIKGYKEIIAELAE